MKKRYLLTFFAIIVINLLFRLIMPDEISNTRATVMTIFIVVLPYIYAFSSFCFTGLSLKTAGIALSAVLLSGVPMIFLGNHTPLLDELGWICMQLPSLVISLAAGYFTFSAETQHKKLKNLGSTILPLVLAFICVHGFCSFMVSWANSSM